MKETFRVWGSRGSCPMTGKTSIFGVNTSCFSLDTGDALFVFDAGSGILDLKRAFTEGESRSVHLFLSHLHMDHIQGLFGFVPLPAWCRELCIYGEPRGGRSLREQLDAFIGPPYWPLTLPQMGGDRIRFTDVLPGESFRAGGRAVSAARSEHPDQSLWYRLEPEEKGGCAVVYGLDCELTEAAIPRLAAFARGAGLLVLDAAYAPEDLPEKRGWGHSSYRECLTLAKESGAARVLLSHLSPEYPDSALASLEQSAAREAGPIDVIIAKEGMVLTI